MKEGLLKYINWKLRIINEQLDLSVNKEIKEIEDFIDLLADLKDGVTPLNVNLMLNHKKLFYDIILKYNILTLDTLKTFFSFLGELSKASPSFSSSNFVFLDKIFIQIKNSEKKLLERYEILASVREDSKKENENLELDKFNLEYAKNDIENGMVITDVSFIEYLLKDQKIDDEYRKRLLYQFIDYNDKMMENYLPLTYREAIELFNEYNYDITNENNLKIICANYKSSTLKDILEKIKFLKIKFKDNVLEEILLKGTSVLTIEEAYNKIKDDDLYDLRGAVQIPFFWISNSYNQKYQSRYNSSVLRNEMQTHTSSNNPLDYTNSESVFKTANYLKDFPFYNPSFIKMTSILKVPVERIENMVSLYGLYNIKKEDIKDSTALSYTSSIDIIDQFIELGLKDYVLEHLAVTGRTKDIPLRLYMKKIHGENILSGSSLNLSSDLYGAEDNYYNLQVKARLVEPELERRKDYDLYLNEINPSTITPNIYKEPLIMELENNNKINNLEYMLGNHIVSRKKVLRIASSIIKIEALSLDSFIYVLTYKTLANKEDMDDLIGEITKVYNRVKVR